MSTLITAKLPAPFTVQELNLWATNILRSTGKLLSESLPLRVELSEDGNEVTAVVVDLVADLDDDNKAWYFSLPKREQML